MPRNPNLSHENRARFRSFAPSNVWQQMAQYGMGQGGAFPGTGDIPHLPGDSEFLVMMLKAFKEQEDEKRKNKKPEYLEGKTYDPILNEAKNLTGR